eukprot:TRINITY_DN5489_c1_g1_i1.p1 TRINITY_DN5489_c1_g1~~TRINITY_DN5489_c1_g1_i1.p1  ORF type:complete len:316 (+),score=89.32 TRINITY_DN5489_c1_g1_i1:64-1011(+)
MAALLTTLIATSLAGLPAKIGGMYCLIADDTVQNYTSKDNWQPHMYPYQANGSNVLWLTFINPKMMPDVPPAMSNFGKCKGQDGCSKPGVPVIFSVGGQSYSNKMWDWLETREAAEAMAEKVAQWPTLHGADGIDLDIEGQAGSTDNVAENLGSFVRKLKSLVPDFIVTQPVYGFPQVAAENYMVNNGWTNKTAGHNWTTTGLIDTVGIMVYGGLSSLQYVKNYANATHQWEGFPITVDVPTQAVLGGMAGSDAGEALNMAKQINKQNLGGYMVWFASFFDKTRNVPAFTYGHGAGDASTQKSSSWEAAIKLMNQ